MSRVFTDKEMLTWEAFASTGPFGLPRPSAIVFQCLSDPDRRARRVRHEDDNASAERLVHELSETALRQLLDESTELE